VCKGARVLQSRKPNSTVDSSEQQDQLLSLLIQISGPSHIPREDLRWSNLFHYYNILAHLEEDFHNHTKPSLSSSSSSSSSNNTSSHENDDDDIHFTKILQEMIKHCCYSSNLATLTLHASRMIRELEYSCWEMSFQKVSSEVRSQEMEQEQDGQPEEEEEAETSHFTLFGSSAAAAAPAGVAIRSSFQHTTTTTAATTSLPKQKSSPVNPFNTNTTTATSTIALVGKARVTAGVLHLLRIFIHPIIVHASQYVPTYHHASSSSSLNDSLESCIQYLQDAFTYKSRQHSTYPFHSLSNNNSNNVNHGKTVDAATELISALLSFLSMAGNGKLCFIPRSLSQIQHHLQNICKHVSDVSMSIPEMYDVTVQCFSLLFILTSSQLYQPMISSAQCFAYTTMSQQQQQQQVMKKQLGYQFFIDIIMKLASSRPGTSTTATTTTTFHSTLVDIIIDDTSPSHSLQDFVFNSLHQQWSCQSILSACFYWFLYRPPPPSRSIAAHYTDLVTTVAQEIHSKMGGFSNSTTITTTTNTVFSSSEVNRIEYYDTTHTIVRACIPSKLSTSSLAMRRDTTNNTSLVYKVSSGLLQDVDIRHLETNIPKSTRLPLSLVYDISSSLLLLPVRLLKLALTVLLRNHNQSLLLPFSHARATHVSPSKTSPSLDLEKIFSLKNAVSTGHLDDEPITNDVLWMSDSIVADFACAFFLLLTNNYRVVVIDESESRNIYRGNPFRMVLSVLDDHRWEATVSNATSNVFHPPPMDSRLLAVSPQSKTLFTLDFELLFQRFTSVVHNEMGSLVLYTLFMSSPIVMTSFLVRSDLDSLVIPLLRTLYMSMTVSHHYSGRTISPTPRLNVESNVESDSVSVHVLERPFRSSSQLYVLLILLLIFSQDSSFGPDSFRRMRIPSVPWYKERCLKDISLGSLLILTLLRCITFNINRLQDPFLLSNACAILLNLSPHIYNLHPYCAMRLASVTISSMKKYAVLYVKKGANEAEHDEHDTIFCMHAEVRIHILMNKSTFIGCTLT